MRDKDRGVKRLLNAIEEVNAKKEVILSSVPQTPVPKKRRYQHAGYLDKDFFWVATFP